MNSNQKRPRVSIIIPSWTGEISRLRSSIERQTFQDYEVLVIQAVSPAARARNQGAAQAKANILLFVDDDAYFGNERVVETLVQLIETDPAIAVVGTSKLAPVNATPFQKAVARQVPRMVYPVVEGDHESNPPLNRYGFTAVTTTCCAVRRDVYEEVGGFDEQLTTGPEDTDFFYRVRQRGYRIIVAGDSWVYHDPPAGLKDLLRKSFWYGLGHALEARKHPRRGMAVIPLQKWYGKLAVVGALLAFPISFFIHFYFDPLQRVAVGFRPLKTLSTYAVLLGYVYGWFNGSPTKPTTTYMGRKAATQQEDNDSSALLYADAQTSFSAGGPPQSTYSNDIPSIAVLSSVVVPVTAHGAPQDTTLTPLGFVRTVPVRPSEQAIPEIVPNTERALNTGSDLARSKEPKLMGDTWEGVDSRGRTTGIPTLTTQPAIASGAARDALLMVSATVIVGVLNYALNITLGWALSTEEYGRVGVSQTLIFLGVWFLSAGFPWVVSRAIARSHNSSPHDHAEGAIAWRTYKTAWLANSLLTAALVMVLLLAFSSGLLPLEPDYTPLIYMVAFTIAALGVTTVPVAGLQGLFRFGRIAGIRIIEAGTNIIISVALVLLGFGAAGALGGFAVSALVICVLSIWLLRDQRFWEAKGWGGLSTLREALPMTLAVFGGVLLTNIDLLAIKFLTGPNNSDTLSGMYQVAAVLARAPFFIGTALVTTYYPRIAQSHADGATQLLRWIGIVVLPLHVVLALGAPAVVRLFFPERYASSASTLAILAMGSAFLVLASALAAILQASNHSGGPAFIMTLAVSLQIAGLLWLVPALDITGAALASATASFLACALLTFKLRARGITPPGMSKQATALILLAVLITPLGLLFADSPRPVVAMWMVIALMLYATACFFLNLVNASELPGHTGPLQHVMRPVLRIASKLNHAGRGRASRSI